LFNINQSEKPIGLRAKEGETLAAPTKWFANRQKQRKSSKIGLGSGEDEFSKLIEYYNGNPLVLKIAATTTIQPYLMGMYRDFLVQSFWRYSTAFRPAV